jgi:hypothetical protein
VGAAHSHEGLTIYGSNESPSILNHAANDHIRRFQVRRCLDAIRDGARVTPACLHVRAPDPASGQTAATRGME